MKTEKMKCLMMGCNNEVIRHPFDSLNGNCNECRRKLLEQITKSDEESGLYQN